MKSMPDEKTPGNDRLAKEVNEIFWKGLKTRHIFTKIYEKQFFLKGTQLQKYLRRKTKTKDLSKPTDIKST